MEKVTFKEVDVNRCSGCRGIWFDLLKHEELKKLKGSEVIDDGDSKIGRENNKIDRIQCPSCQTPMIRMVDREQPHIWYESCSVCHGVYFDAGEFRDFKSRTLIDIFRDLLAGPRE